jgi:hypothetical protein
MKFNKALREAVPEYEIPEYDEGALVDALMSNKPALDLKEVFGEAFYPKIIRWLEKRLKKINVPPEVTNYVGGPLKYKFDTYLEKNKDEDTYRDNAEVLSREILKAIEEWGKKVMKDNDLPEPKF